MRRVLTAITTGAALATVLLGASCGARGPLDDTPIADATASVIDATTDAPADAGVDGGLEAGIAACGICVLTTCSPTITSCLSTPSCLRVFQCVATTCLGLGLPVPGPTPAPNDAGREAAAADGGASGDAGGGAGGGGGGSGGGIDTACLLGCAARDPGGALQVFSIFQCLSGACGAPCGPILGGIAGGIPGLGGRELLDRAPDDREPVFARSPEVSPELFSRRQTVER